MDKSYIETEKRLVAIEAHLADVYDRAQVDIQRKADAYFEQFVSADEKKRALVEKGKLDADTYERWRKNKIMYGRRFAALKEQLATEYANVNKTALSYINGELPEVYALNYNSLAPDVDGVGGYSFTLTDANTVKYLATTNDSLLPYKQLDVAKDIAWSTKKINSEVLRGILQGEKITDIAKRLENVTTMEKSAAVRNARTMVTGAQNKGRLDSYARAEADGIILQKEWLATNDGRTRHWHAALDGQQRDQDKPFDSEYGKIMYPGDPSAHPANVYNCRCTLVANVKGFKKVQVQKAMAEKQEIFEEPETFDELSKSMNIKISKKARELDFVTTKDAIDGISWVERQFPEMKGFIEKIDSNKKGGVMNTTGRIIACSPSAFSGSYYKGNHLFFQRTGVHEATHSAEGYLISKISKSKEEYSEMWNNHTIARSICKDALDEVLKTEYGKGKTARELYSSISEYATMSSSECMAEAVADVFEHREKANSLSLVIFEQIKKRMKL